MNETNMNELKLRWLTKAEAYADLYEQLNQYEYSQAEIQIMLLGKIKAINEMVDELGE